MFHRTSDTATATKHDKQVANKETEVRQKTIKSAENQLTKMLLLVTTPFLILLIPTYFRFIYLTLVKRDTPSKFAGSFLFFDTLIYILIYILENQAQHQLQVQQV